jgi:hypothetical protein
LFKRVNASGVTGFLSVDEELSLLIRMGPFIGPFGVFGRFLRLNKLGLLWLLVLVVLVMLCCCLYEDDGRFFLARFGL